MKNLTLPIPVIVGGFVPFVLLKFSIMIGVVVSIGSVVAYLAVNYWLLIALDAIFGIATISAICNLNYQKNMVFMFLWWTVLLLIFFASLFAIIWNFVILAILFLGIYQIDKPKNKSIRIGLLSKSSLENYSDCFFNYSKY